MATNTNMGGKGKPKIRGAAISLPELSFGDWVQNNDQWLAPAMKIAGAAANFIPGAGPIIGGVVQAGAEGVSAYGQSADQADATRQSSLNNRRAAYNASLAPPKMETGGFLKYSGQTHAGPNGGIPIDAMGNPAIISKQPVVATVTDGEVRANIDGKPYIFSEETGTAKKASKIEKRYKKRLKYGDKISETGLKRELQNLVAENEKLKATEFNQPVPPEQLLYGDDVPPLKGNILPGAPVYRYQSPSLAMNGLNRAIWAEQNYGTVAQSESDSYRPPRPQPEISINPGAFGSVNGNTGNVAVDNNIYKAQGYGQIEPIVVTANKQTATPASSTTSTKKSGWTKPEGAPKYITNFAGPASLPYQDLVGNSKLPIPGTSIDTTNMNVLNNGTAATSPEVYDPAKAALPGIIGQGIAAVGGNALAAALYKKPQTINPALINPTNVSYLNERLSAEENATLAKRSAVQTARASGSTSAQAIQAQANAANTAINSAVGQQLGQSFQREADVNAGRQYDASVRNAGAKTSADMFNTQMLQDYRDKKQGYLESAVSAIQGAGADYRNASNMGDLLSIEAGRSGYQIVIDPKTGKKMLVPVPGFWDNKTTE